MRRAPSSAIFEDLAVPTKCHKMSHQALCRMADSAKQSGSGPSTSHFEIQQWWHRRAPNIADSADFLVLGRESLDPEPLDSAVRLVLAISDMLQQELQDTDIVQHVCKLCSLCVTSVIVNGAGVAKVYLRFRLDADRVTCVGAWRWRC